jgi:toxin HigB-1
LAGCAKGKDRRFRQRNPSATVCALIQSFANADTQQLFREEKNRRFAPIVRVALRKLMQMNRAARLSDLAVPPGNRLEALRGELAGFHSIRINDQWRVIFRWTEAGPAKVAIVDYH